jgi:hypothetical protein
VKLPTLTDLTTAAHGAWPFLVSAGAVLAVAAVVVVMLMRRTRRNRMTLENRLTFLVAIIAAGIAAQGMWRFFRDILGFPLELRIVAFAVLELVTFTCALRARRNIREAKRPEDAKAGVDGVAVWVVTALSGAFSATDADKWPEAVFRLLMPLLAAWLWERGMSIERQRIRKKHNEDPKIHLRLTPERILVWLRIAEPSGRTASEVDAHRRLTRVARAAAKVRSLRNAGCRKWRIVRAEKRLERSTLSAVAHANLGSDPERKAALISQVRFIFNSVALADMAPQSPWSEVAGTDRSALAVGSAAGPVTVKLDRSDPSRSGETGSEVSGSETHRSETYRTRTQVPDLTPDRSETHTPDQSQEEVPDQTRGEVPTGRSETHQTQSAPKKQTRTDPLDRIDEARAVDRAHLAEHGRHISAENLRKALGIGKPAALELVKQIRGGHIDIAK